MKNDSPVATAPPLRKRSDEPSAAHRKGLGGNPWLTLIAVALGVMMVALDGTVVAIANPSISKDLGASLADLQWVTNGYLLALAVCLIPAGKLGDRFGHKTVFLTGATGFALTSLAIGFSKEIGVLITLRVVQGVFGAMLQPTALGLLRSAFPREKLNMAIGIWAAAISSSTAAGPIVGGLLVQHVSWESVFFINVPLGAIAVGVGFAVLRGGRTPGASGGLDLPGVALLSAAMFFLVFGVIKAPDKGWTGAFTLLFLGGAVLLLALFVGWQMRARDPLMPLGMFRNRSFSIGIVLMLMMAFSMFGALFFLTFYLEGVHGLSPVETGVRMLPMTVGMVVGSPLGGALISRFGPRPPIMAGLSVAAVAMFVVGNLGAHAGYASTALGLAMLGIGLSPVMVGATDVIVGNASVELAGVASGIQQAAMQVGGALGTAVLGAVMAAKVSSSLPGHWASAGLGTLDPGQQDAIKGVVSQGFAPVPQGTSPGTAARIADAAHASFLDGMHMAFTISGVALIATVVLSFFVRKGEVREGAVAVHV